MSLHVTRNCISNNVKNHIIVNKHTEMHHIELLTPIVIHAKHITHIMLVLVMLNPEPKYVFSHVSMHNFVV